MDPRCRELLGDLLIAWEDAYDEGHDVSAADLARDHPELVEQLARRIRVLRATYWIDHPPDPDCNASVVEARPPGGHVLAGGYRLDERIAVGGFAEA